MPGYGSDEAFETWATANGYTVSDGDVGPARARGSAYIDGTYGDRFPGEPTDGIEQDRAWPRTGATDKWGNEIADDAVPTRVEHAAYEAALLELATPGSLGKTFTPAEQKVLVQVQSIRWQPVGDGRGGQMLVSTKIEGLLEPLLTSSADIPAILVV